MKPKILIADDDPTILTALRLLLGAEGYAVRQAQTPDEVEDACESLAFDAILMDLNYARDTTSGGEGLDLIRVLRQTDPHTPIVVMTGWGTVPVAVEAMKRGANDFIQKPWENSQLLRMLTTQIQLCRSNRQERHLSRQNQLLREALYACPGSGLIARSQPMRELLQRAEQLARSDMNLLLRGENGTGKTILADYLHRCSGRAKKPFIAVNMGAIADNLFESEMFGHVRGAFTDARGERIGRFELAHGGSLFLDEVANIPLGQQAKLLRVLESCEFERLGSSRTLTADVRVISATNGDLPALVTAGHFRQDLLYRLNTVELVVPPLRNRGADILPLARYFLNKFAKKYQKKPPRLGSEAITALQNYSWPGNVRELRHAMERSLFIAGQDTLSVPDLGLNATHEEVVPAGDWPPPAWTLAQIEHQAISARLAHHQGQVMEAARSLGLSRSAFYRKLKKGAHP